MKWVGEIVSPYGTWDFVPISSLCNLLCGIKFSKPKKDKLESIKCSQQIHFF